MVTHFFDTSAALAHYFAEPGEDRVDIILHSPKARVGLSAISVFEIAQAVAHRTGDVAEGERAASVYAGLVHEILPVTMEIVILALDLRRASATRIALADILIAATAAYHGATLVHRYPHFASLPAGRPAQEALPEKEGKLQ